MFTILNNVEIVKQISGTVVELLTILSGCIFL
jgi:hypothetical protein